MGFWDNILRILNKKDTKEESKDRIDILLNTPIQYQDDPSKRINLNQSEIRKILRYNFGDIDIYISDSNNCLANESYLIPLLDICKVNEIKYRKDQQGAKSFDCDQFSNLLYSLVGCADGTITIFKCWGKNSEGQAHAMNGYIKEDRSIVLIEPQNNKRMNIGTCQYKMYYIEI